MKEYFNHRRLVDFVAATLFASAVYFQPIKLVEIFRWPTGTSFETLMLAISASSSTMVGFVLAASTFLITHTNDERFAMLRASAGFAQLLAIVRSAMWRLILLTIVAGFGTLASAAYQHAVLGILSFFVAWAILGIATLTWCTLSILSIRAV